MSHAPMHSKPLQEDLAVLGARAAVVGLVGVDAGGLAERVEQRRRAPRSQQEMLWQTSTWWRAHRAGAEEVVEGRDRLQVGRASRPSPRPPGGCPRACTSRSGAARPTGPEATAERISGYLAIAASISLPQLRPGTSTSWSSGTGSASSGRIEVDRAARRILGRTCRRVGDGSPANRYPSLTGRSPRGSGRASPGSGSGRRCSRRGTCRAGLQVHERGVADVDPRGLRRAVRDDEATELAARDSTA